MKRNTIVCFNIYNTFLKRITNISITFLQGEKPKHQDFSNSTRGFNRIVYTNRPR